MNESYLSALEKKGIRPSIQRVAVYTYLCEHPIHPTVDTVYESLSKEYPTLSKTTIYNTLKLFADNNLVQTLHIEDDKLNYDANVEPHIHFKCTKCSKIFDVFSKDLISECNAKYKQVLPKGFTSKIINTYITGTCQSCEK